LRLDLLKRCRSSICASRKRRLHRAPEHWLAYDLARRRVNLERLHRLLGPL
jgi:hypothetical protein